MKVFNVILSVFVLLFAVVLAVSSVMLYKHRVELLGGWNQFSEVVEATASKLDEKSGTKMADTLNKDNLQPTNYLGYHLEGADLGATLQELTAGAENLMKQRDQYIETFRKIALSVDMKGIPSADKMSSVDSSAKAVSDVSNAVYNFKNRRDNLVNAITASAKVVGVNLNANAMRNDNDPGKALNALNVQLKNMKDQLERYKAMANELARLSGSRAATGDSVSEAIKTTDAIKKSFNELNAKLNATQRSLQSANSQIAQLKNTLANRDSKIRDKEQELGAQKEENTVLKSIIGMDDENIEKPWLAGSEEARKEVVGKVIEVNARFGIVGVDLGAMTRVIQWLGNKNTQVDPKIENGMKLNIVRNFDTPDVKLIVKGAEVTNVADRCSIVEVAADDIANVKVGDTVIVDFVK